MFELENFSKKYSGAKDYSVKDVSFRVEDGEVCGIVGSNGAGKSTIIKSITGILPFDEGKIIVNGFDINKDAVKAKKTIGYVPDDHTVYEKLTGREYVDYMGSLYGVSKDDKKKVIDTLAERLNITHALDNQISSYSHGMKQKICIIGALMHSPALWILDEPMLGLDPGTMKEVMQMIREYAAEGKSVLFSSHNLEVVEKVCDKIVFIVKGRLAAVLDMKTRDKKFNLDAYFTQLNEE